MRRIILWLLRPFFRYRLRKLEAPTGPESYTEQMRRHRLIATLRQGLQH